ncbi:MAG: transcription-repair coupling factor, partial [Brevibacterium sp.]|nr:transcription-repair coupling factor [Brevibacterium sp.]
MVLNGLDLTRQNSTITDLVSAINDPETAGGTIDAIRGLWPSILRRTLVSAEHEPSTSAPQLIVTATTREAEDLARSLADWVPEDSIAIFPSWETLPHEKLSPRSDTVGQRLQILHRLAHPSPDRHLAFIIAPVRAFLQPLVKGLGDIEPVELAVGDEYEIDELAKRLTELAYSRVDMVSRRGEFAVRGGIVDIFPPTEDHALRIEFFGDEIDEIREFSVSDQRSIPAEADSPPLRLSAPPCRELLLTDSIRERAAALSPTLPEASDMLDKIAGGIAVEGMESLSAVLADGMEPIIALLPDSTKIIITEPERVQARAADLVVTTNEFLEAAWTGAAGGGEAPIDLSAATFRTMDEMEEGARLIGLAWWELGGFATDEELVSPTENLFPIPARAPKGYAGDVEAILADV